KSPETRFLRSLLVKTPKLVPHADQIHKQPYSAGYSGRKLTEESVAGINEDAFAIARYQPPAFLRRFARIVGSQQRFELRVPLRHEVQTAFLHPAVKIPRRDFVGIRKYPLFRCQDFYRLLFNGYARVAGSGWIRGVMAIVEQAGALVVLNDERSALVDVIEQTAALLTNIGAAIVSAGAHHNRTVPAEVA